MQAIWVTYGADVTAGLLFAVGLWMLFVEDWRGALVGLALLYGGATVLVAQSWPWTLAATVLVSGWMAASVLGLSRQQGALPPSPTRLSARLLRGMAGVLAGVLAAAFVSAIRKWLMPLTIAQAWGSLTLMLLGMWQVGLRSNRPLWVSVGLLTILAGFEVLYAPLEQSLLIAGLLALVVIALGVAGGYLVIQASPQSFDDEVPS